MPVFNNMTNKEAAKVLNNYKMKAEKAPVSTVG